VDEGPNAKLEAGNCLSQGDIVSWGRADSLAFNFCRLSRHGTSRGWPSGRKLNCQLFRLSVCRITRIDSGRRGLIFAVLFARVERFPHRAQKLPRAARRSPHPPIWAFETPEFLKDLPSGLSRSVWTDTGSLRSARALYSPSVARSPIWGTHLHNWVPRLAQLPLRSLVLQGSSPRTLLPPLARRPLATAPCPRCRGSGSRSCGNLSGHKPPLISASEGPAGFAVGRPFLLRLRANVE